MGESGFVHTFLPGRVVFGAGRSTRSPPRSELLGVRRVLVVATKSARDAADVVEVELRDRFAGRIDGVAQHVPTEVAEAARAQGAETGADGIVAIGGGSAIGLAKAIALSATERAADRLPVPTTYAGSEMTPVWGETAGGSKTTGTDLRVLPRTVVYDPVLSQHLPMKVTAASVANAIAHCVEAVWTPKADPITETTAVEGVRALTAGLRHVFTTPPIWMPGATFCTAPASADPHWRRPEPACITSCVTCSAAPTTSRTRRPTPQYSPRSPA